MPDAQKQAAVEAVEVRTDTDASTAEDKIAEELKWKPKTADRDADLAEYYEAESWQFSGCGD